jgi:Ni,Fe-hydrogenase maturation factor
MKVYVFGNKDMQADNLAFEVAEKLKNTIKDIEFVEIKPNEDLPFASEGGGESVIILDTVEGINNVTLFDDLDKFILPPRSSVHDFDLSFQLKYLKKIGKLNCPVIIIGLPMQSKVDYFLIQSILRKLVAHDIQGS